MLLAEKSHEPDFPPVFQGLSLEKGRVALFFLVYRDFFGELPGYYLKKKLNSNKVYAKSLN
ncbi:hypothetical protein D3H55_08505 [Bacillus salacetis]|uniref:Uncharacterized protein n=1 Tax=Bacillus salacetis TaxID=2315464 RepID=A0A3A1R078_9BACI|nr:hypothetical protein D3H55_08505 [Bacillus salacetis]